MLGVDILYALKSHETGEGFLCENFAPSGPSTRTAPLQKGTRSRRDHLGVDLHQQYSKTHKPTVNNHKKEPLLEKEACIPGHLPARPHSKVKG
jgi:hypothetical protein